MELTTAQRDLLLEVYRFQKPRNFRYGKPLHYLPRRLRAEVEALKSRGLLFTLAPYRSKNYRYVFLTKKGRWVVEKDLLRR